MTHAAKNLFARANEAAPERTSAALPTSSGGIARKAYQRATAAGIDAAPLLAACGLTERQATSPDIRVPVRTQIDFLNVIADALGDDLLGFHLGLDFDLRELGLLYYVTASSETLGDAVRRVARYSTILNEGVLLTYDDRRGMRVTLGYDGVGRVRDRHQIELFVTALLRTCRHLTGRELTPVRVRLQHRRGPAPLEVRRFFGCPVEFASEIDEVALPTTARTLPVVHADAYLNALLVHYCDEALARRRPRSGDWRLRVENALVPLLPHGKPDMDDVARRLGVSRRTLARRLTAEGVSFATVLQHLRLALAKRYLQDQEMQISEAAWLLGYNDSSAFSHAFRRWTGRPPRQARSTEPGAR